jgi:suppressor for copper-sensitivity B
MKLLMAVLALLALVIGPAHAEPAGEGAWALSESGRVRLISATDATGDRSGLRLGLEFQLEPGWKIYWRMPGDAGLPPSIDWAGSENLAGTPVIRWPAPHRFVLSGLQNYGYAGQVVLPLEAEAGDAGRPVHLRAAVEFLACAQICVPRHADLALDLPAGSANPTAVAHDIGRFIALVPGDGSAHGLSLGPVVASGTGDETVLHLEITATQPLEAPDAFIESDDAVSFDQPRIELAADRLSARLDLKVAPHALQKPLAGSGLRITVTDGIRVMERQVTALAGSAPGGGWVLASMLAVALLGGAILNLMPCVLPVLSIKVLGALGHGGADIRHVRASFLASALGILVSFWALAGVAIGLKSAGLAVGWGIQFQQPAFLVAMLALLVLFALNLWGLFEIPMPGWLLSQTGAGIPHHSLAGHFLSGSFATLLATPCSAPFLGTAVGFALARGPGEILAIFTMLGIGMAAPFLALAARPGAAQRLPRPGPWMVTVKKGLGVALAGTAVWLGSVLWVQLAPPATSTTRWAAFDQAAIQRAVADGKLVFVDVTADWCITCKVNKAAVIDRDPVAARLSEADVVAMKADWTRPDAAISAYLASFGRYGIPFNAVYGPKAPAGLALPELPSAADILAALDKAR